jgi:hypothetical protein
MDRGRVCCQKVYISNNDWRTSFDYANCLVLPTSWPARLSITRSPVGEVLMKENITPRGWYQSFQGEVEDWIPSPILSWRAHPTSQGKMAALRVLRHGLRDCLA